MKDMQRHCVGFRLVMILTIAVCMTLSMGFAGGKPTPPPPNPLNLSMDLNIISAEVGSNTRLRAWHQGSDGIGEIYSAKWTYPGTSAAAVVFADVDGDGWKELVYPAFCTTCIPKSTQTVVYLNAFHQGQDGIAYTSYSSDLNNLILDNLGGWNNARAVDLDNDKKEEIILFSASHITTFHYKVNNGKGYLEKWKEVCLLKLVQDYAGTTITLRRGLDVGDVDADGQSEMICAVSYRNAARQDVEYLLIFDDQMNLKSFTYLYESIGDFSINDLRIADSDGDGINEIWCSGWVNEWDISKYHQRVYSWMVNPITNQLELNAVPALDLGDMDTLGPNLDAGKLLGSDKDQIIVEYYT